MRDGGGFLAIELQHIYLHAEMIMALSIQQSRSATSNVRTKPETHSGSPMDMTSQYQDP